MSNYLIIVEGAVEEESILRPTLEKNNFTVIKHETLNFEFENIFEKYKKISLEKENNVIIVVQGFRNRLHDFLKMMSEYDEISEYFNYSKNYFAGIFLVYDVDHTIREDLLDMYEKFNNPSTGLLLISNPCIQVLIDESDGPLEYLHLIEYKEDLRKKFCNCSNAELIEKISSNMIRSLKKYYLKNRMTFNKDTLDEEVEAVIRHVANSNEVKNDKINKEKYYYLTTVIYYIIAYINKYTYRENENELLMKKLNMLETH